jgi:predicted nucleic acid-binding protein
LYYLDSSAVVKLIFIESESTALRRFLKGDLVSSDLTKIEVYRVCARLDKSSIKVADQVIKRITFFDINQGVISQARNLVDIPYLKSLDSIHIATVKGIQNYIKSVITYDKQMIRALQDLKLPTASPA